MVCVMMGSFVVFVSCRIVIFGSEAAGSEIRCGTHNVVIFVSCRFVIFGSEVALHSGHRSGAEERERERERSESLRTSRK